MKLSTESILTGVYGIPATPVQRAACRARDGLPLDDLRDHPDVVAAFGGAEAIAALPSERGIKPAEFWNIASARTAKTTLACAGALADSQSIPATWGPGEVPRISLLSVKLDVADVPYRKLRAAFDHPVFRPLLVSERESDRTLTVLHPSGRTLEIAATAGGQAGIGLANRWSGGVIADEAPKMNARADDRATNLDDVLSVARERMLDGAQIDAIGSPWSPHGTAYDVVQQYFGKPTDEIVVMRTTGPAGNPTYWTPERLERLKAKDEIAWRINALGEFIDPETGLLNPVSIRANTRETPLELPQGPGTYAAGVDPSEGGARGNAFSLVIVRIENETSAIDGGMRSIIRPKWRVVLAREWRGLGVAGSWEAVAEACARYGIRTVTTDRYSGGAGVAVARGFGLTVNQRRLTPATKLEAFSSLATLIHTDRVELPPHREFLRDLRSIKKRTTQNGQVIHLPETGDGRHCDLADAFCAAMAGAFDANEAEQRRARIARAESQLAAVANGSFGQLQDLERMRAALPPETRTPIGYRKKYLGAALGYIDEPIFADDNTTDHTSGQN